MTWTVENYHISKSIAKVLAVVLGINMIIQSLYIGKSVYDTILEREGKLTMSLKDLAACFIAWSILSFVGGVAMIYAALKESIKTCYFSIFVWLFMIVCQLVECTIAVAVVCPQLEDCTQAKMTVMTGQTFLICLISVAFIASIRFYAYLLEIESSTSISTSNQVDDVYVPLMDDVEGEAGVYPLKMGNLV